MRASVIVPFLIIGALAGCGVNQDISGVYHGRLAIQAVQGVTSHRIEAAVSGRVARFDFTIKDRDTDRDIADVSVRANAASRTLTVRSTIFSNRKEIRLAGAGTCAGASNSAPYEAEVCVADGVLSLSYREGGESVYFQAYTAAVNEDDPLKPGAYSIPDLVDITKKQNLDVLLKAQEVYRAREEVLLRRGNLFPNFNLGTILAAAESPFALLSQVGNLLPFLFPDNWYRYAASKDLRRAQELSYQSLKANQVNLVVGVSLTTLKDLALKAAIQAHVADLNDVLERVQLLIKAGQAPSSWEPIVRMRIISDQEDLIAYEQFLSEQNVGLQKLLGAQPTKPGITVIPVELPAIDPSLVHDLSAEEAQAVAESPELKSTIFLEQAAKKLVKAAKWSWLNPSTDPRFNLGLGLEHAINIEKSHVEDVKLKRADFDHTIRGNVIDIERGIKFLVDQYELARVGEEAARNGLKNAMKQLEIGQLGLLDTIEFVEQLFKYRTKKLAAQFAYLIVRDKLHRHTLSGFYAELPLPEPE